VSFFFIPVHKICVQSVIWCLNSCIDPPLLQAPIHKFCKIM